MTGHAQRAHAALSPSAAHRWFNCPGSIRLSAGIERQSSVFADEGTAAHELAQLCLTVGIDAAVHLGDYVNIDAPDQYDKKFVSRPVPGKRCFEITDEMVESVQLYVDHVRDFMVSDCDWEWEIEAKLDLRHVPGMAFGTGDFVAYRSESKLLVIRDFKYGKGVPVEVEGNEQLLTYAVGTARRFHNRGLEAIDLGVVQPRCPHKDGPVRSTVIDAVDLVEFRARLADAAAATAGDDAPLVPGEWCKWCPAAVECPARQQRNRILAEMEFEGTPVEVGELSAERLAGILAEASHLEDWIKRVKERAHQVALQGGLPGYKFVRSTSHRKFKDEASAARFMLGILELPEDDIYKPQALKSPAQIEKLLGVKRKGEIVDLVYKPPGKIILVPESDPREPVKPDAEEEFA